jgi:hypothetical protein
MQSDSLSAALKQQALQMAEVQASLGKLLNTPAIGQGVGAAGEYCRYGIENVSINAGSTSVPCA